ncbi:hypothetical protein ACVWYS_002378 [Arthrobacter sp. TE12231]|uniref:hypothetical protein n=1 Tax=Arthrobacter humicola TaxID=409291 RepID=UPI0031D0AEEC
MRFTVTQGGKKQGINGPAPGLGSTFWGLQGSWPWMSTIVNLDIGRSVNTLQQVNPPRTAKSR